MANELRVSAAALVVVYESASLTFPDTPTLTIPAAGLLADGGLWYGSAYSHNGTSIMADAEIQVDDTSSAFGSLVISGALGGPIISGQLTGLNASSNYWARLRYKDAAGNWSDWSTTVAFTTTALVAPNQPVISLPTGSPGETWTALQSTAYSHPSGITTNPHGATVWQVATDSGFASIVWDSGLSGNLLLHFVFGLTQNTPYFARAAWVDSFGQQGAWSATLSFTTATAPGARPATPTLTSGTPGATTIMLTGSAFSGGTGTHASSEWQVATANTFLPAEMVYNVGPDTVNLTSLTVTGLTVGVTYYGRLRYTDDDTPLGADSLWSTTQSWTQAATLSVPRWTAPIVGAAVRGGAVALTWSITSPEGDATYQIDYSADDGQTWSSIAAAATGTSDTWDASALTDGTYLLRIRQESVIAADESIWAYTTVFVDNGLDVALFAIDESQLGLPAQESDWTRLLDTHKCIWDSSYYASPAGRWLAYANPATAFTWPLWLHGPSAIAWNLALEPTAFDMVAECEIVGQRGGFKWATGYDVEIAGAGVGGRLSGTSGVYSGDWNGTSQYGVIAYVYINPAGTTFTPPIGKGAATLVVRVLDGSANGHFTFSTALGFEILSSDHLDLSDKAPYNMRLKVTQIRDNGDGTEDLRIRVGLYGPEVDPSGTGWVFDQAVSNVPQQCGKVGYVAEGGSGQSYNNTGSKQFRSLGVRGIDYGSCTAPGGFIPPTGPESCAPPAFDLTIMDSTDTAALIGTFTNGVVVDASFSTLPSHARPYLKFTGRDHPQHDIDPIRGKASIGQVNVGVLDKRSDPCDWATGALTQHLGDVNARSQLNGRRAILRERLGDGTWVIVLDGVIYSTRLDRNLVTYELALRDFRERERDTRLFPTPNKKDPVTGEITPTSYVFPIGPAEDWGVVTTQQGSGTSTAKLVPASVPATGTFHRWSGQTDYGRIDTTFPVEDLHEDHYVVGRAEEMFDVNGVSLGQRWPKVILQWRLPGGATWNTYENMPSLDKLTHPLGVLDTSQNVFMSKIGFSVTVRVQISWPGGTAPALPADGATVEFRVIANAPPSPAFPLYWEGNSGTLLQEIYDGYWSEEDMREQYNATAMAAFVAGAVDIRLKMDEPVDDARPWIEENIYMVNRWVPAIDDQGAICPVDTAVPNAGASLSTLDETNTRNGEWVQDGGDSVQVVEFAYLRDHIELQTDPTNFDNVVQVAGKAKVRVDKRWWFDKTVTKLLFNVLVSRPVEIIQISAYAATSGLKSVRFEPDSVRTIGDSLGGAFFPAQQIGVQIANSVIRDIMSRYPTGPQFVTVHALNTATVRSLKVGNHVILDLDWIPNLGTNDRGGSLLGLIVGQHRRNNLLRTLTILLEGQNQTGMSAPTMGTPTANTNGSVNVPVTTVPASTTTVVQTAVAPTVPAEGSGAWLHTGTLSASGTSLDTAPYFPESTVWVRARSEQVGFRPTTWSTPVSVSVTGPALISLRLTIAQDGTPTVFWSKNQATLGLKIGYEVHAQGTVPAYTSSVEIDANSGAVSGYDSGYSSGYGSSSDGEHQYAFSETVSVGQMFSVKVTPYDGWTGSEVSGNAGIPQNVSEIPQKTLRASAYSSGYSLGYGATPVEEGSTGRTMREVDADYTLSIYDRGALVDASGGAVTITLPPVADAEGFEFTVTKIDSSANAVTIDGDGSETINGATTEVLALQWSSPTLIPALTSATDWVAT